MSTNATVTVGTPAPAFALPTLRGRVRTLADYVAEGPLLLAFHRGIW